VSATAPISVIDKMRGKDNAQHISARMTFKEPKTDKTHSPKSVGNITAGRLELLFSLYRLLSNSYTHIVMTRHPRSFFTLYRLTDRPYALLCVVCFAEVISMLSFAAWPLFLVKLQPLWGLSNFSVGWVSGAYFIGYVFATPVLVGLTDRYDAKYIYILSTLIAAVGAFGFALTAQGFWSAAFYWGLVGAGLAGTYMPGLQILNARLDDDHRLRLLPYYTSAFGIGTGLSFFVMGWLYSYATWTSAFIYAGLGSLSTGAISQRRDPATACEECD